MWWIPVLSHSSLLYLTGIFLRFSNSKELSWKRVSMLYKSQKSTNWCSADYKFTTVNQQIKSISHHCQLLSRCFSKCLGPSCFSWVTLLLEVLVAFWSAESECLYFQKTERTTNILRFSSIKKQDSTWIWTSEDLWVVFLLGRTRLLWSWNNNFL